MKGVALGQDAEGSIIGTVLMEAAHSGMCVQDAIAIAGKGLTIERGTQPQKSKGCFHQTPY